MSVYRKWEVSSESEVEEEKGKNPAEAEAGAAQPRRTRRPPPDARLRGACKWPNAATHSTL